MALAACSGQSASFPGMLKAASQARHSAKLAARQRSDWELREDWEAAGCMLARQAVVQCRAMRLLSCILAALLLIVPGPPLLAADSAAIRQAIDDFLYKRIKTLPGKASYSIGMIDADRLTGACEGLDVSMETGARPWGTTQAVVRCRGGPWTLRVQVQIRVTAEYLVLARPISAGQRLTDADVRGQTGELSDLPPNVLMDKELAVGRAAINALAAGRPLRADMLRLPTIVQQGQNVKVLGTGSGFQVTNEGRALSSAVVGQVIQVRLNSGQIVSGVVRGDGAVEIRF